MNPKLIPDRWQRILSLVEQDKSATIERIAGALGKSTATVRRDLARLAQRGLLKRVRGGAVSAPQPYLGRTLAESRASNPQVKEQIGRAAAALLSPGDCLMLDGGFTAYQVAKHLPPGPFSVVTNSFDVAQVLVDRTDVSLVLIGGTLNVRTGTTVGGLAEQQILQHSADKAVLGTDAVSLQEGVTSPNPDTARTKKAIVARSRILIVVADHTKLGRLEVHHVAPAQAITTLVTDAKADKSLVAAFRAAGVDVVLAK